MELIISHINCDFDSFASMIAASLLHPEASICLVGSPETNVKKFLDAYQNRFNLIKEKNVEPEKITKLIIVDNRDPKRMGKIGKYLEDKYETGDTAGLTIICYDHHPDSDNDIYNDYSHTQPTGACTTIMLDLLNQAGVQITPFQASLFALGIYEDTGNFLNVSTTYKDLAAASYLFTVGASLDLILSYLPKDFTARQFKIINKMITTCETITIRGVSVSFIEMKLQSYRDDLAFLLQAVKKSKNMKLVFCLTLHNDKVDIIARNDYDFIRLDSVLTHFGGGGHKSAGFASVEKSYGLTTKSTSNVRTTKPALEKSGGSDVPFTRTTDGSDVPFSISDIPDNRSSVCFLIKQDIIKHLEAQISEYGVVKDIMTSPADSVPPDTPLGEARQLLLHNNYSTIIVTVDNKIKGILTKKDISKSLHHKMAHLPVESCMSVNVVTVRQEESVYNAYKTMVDLDIGRLPVVDENGDLAGVITRKDLLLHHFHYLSASKVHSTDFDNLKSIIMRQLNRDIQDILRQAGHIAGKLGVTAYVVGGFVRDLLLGQPNYDVDFVIEGDGITFAKEYSKKFGKRVITFPKFGTAFVILKNGKRIDFTTARTEHYPVPGSLPRVSFSGIRNDLFRRDFTINSMAVCINPGEFGKLMDFYGGRRDLRLGIIKVLNNFSFVEDPIRILRAVRFEQRFDFEIEEKTLHLLRKSLQLLSLKNVSAERIRAELIYSTKKGPVHKVFSRLEELGILKQINQNLVFSIENKTICLHLNELIIWFRNNFPKEKLYYWMSYHLALINGLSLRVKEKYAASLKYPTVFLESIRKADKYVRLILPRLNEMDDEGQIALDLLDLSIESILYILALTKDKDCKDKLTRFITVNRFIKPAIGGTQIMSLGIPEGKEVGIIIKRLRKEKINGNLETADDELVFVRNYAASIESPPSDS